MPSCRATRRAKALGVAPPALLDEPALRDRRRQALAGRRARRRPRPSRPPQRVDIVLDTIWPPAGSAPLLILRHRAGRHSGVFRRGRTCGPARPAAVAEGRQRADHDDTPTSVVTVAGAPGKSDPAGGLQPSRRRLRGPVGAHRVERQRAGDAHRGGGDSRSGPRAATSAARDRRPAASVGAATRNSGSRVAPGNEAREHDQPGDADRQREDEEVAPAEASASRPAGGPARTRGIVKRLESSAYCVAENRFCVRRSRSTPKAPLPRPRAA